MTRRLPPLRMVLLSFIAFACIGVPSALAATDFVPLAPIPGLTDQATANKAIGPGGMAAFFNQLYVFCIGAAVMLAVIMIIWGGLEYSLSESITSKGAGKSKIYNALFGLVLVLSPALVFSIINPKILQLNINMPALNTPWGNYVPPDTSGAITGACTSSSCSGEINTCILLGKAYNYVCLDAAKKVVRNSPTPITCNSGEGLGVQCP